MLSTLKLPSSFASCSFIEFVDTSKAVMVGVFSGVGMSSPLERILSNEEIDLELKWRKY